MLRRPHRRNKPRGTFLPPPHAPLHRPTHIHPPDYPLALTSRQLSHHLTSPPQTKLDPLLPSQTLPLRIYLHTLIPLLHRRHFHSRTIIQSFDWRTLIGIKSLYPTTRTVALVDPSTIAPVDRGVGGYPWLGGIDLQRDFKGLGSCREEYRGGGDKPGTWWTEWLYS